MRAHECHHCRQWIEEGAAHDCWTTTEAALTDDLSDDLKEGVGAAARGSRRARRAAHLCVRHGDHVLAYDVLLLLAAERSFLQLVMFLGRTIRAPEVRRVERMSKTKLAHIVQIRHRDEVES